MSSHDQSQKNSRGKSGVARALRDRVAMQQMTKASEGDHSPLGSAQSESNSPIAQTTSQKTLPTRQAPISPAVSSDNSVERSVRLFRVYEALRSGDTATITKVIGLTSATPAEGRRGSATSTALPSDGSAGLEGTTLLHLAVQCADTAVVEYVLMTSGKALDINAKDKDGNTPLHVASSLSRAPIVRLLLDQQNINDSIVNYQGKTALELAKSPDVYQQLQLARSVYVDARVKDIQGLVTSGNYDKLEELLGDQHFQSAVDVNGGELATEPVTMQTGGTLLHEAARKKDSRLIQVLLLNGADPFRRDRKGKLPQDVTKDDKTRAILKKSPAAAAAQRGIQEKTVLGSGTSQVSVVAGDNNMGGKEAREMKGYLKKWTNYTSGYKLRWFVLEDGVLSYYKHQDDAGSACRGAINMRIASLHMDAQDKLRFEIHGKSSVKYHLKANHQIEAKRWFWALNNAIQWTKDEAKEERRRAEREAEVGRQLKSGHLDRPHGRPGDPTSRVGSKAVNEFIPGSSTGLSRTPTVEDDDGASVGDPSVAGDDVAKLVRVHNTTVIHGDLDDEEEYGDDASSIEAHPANKDAFMISAQSARLQLDLLSQITTALQAHITTSPQTLISEPNIVQALGSYEMAIANLSSLIGDLGRIGRDREAYWQYRLEQEVNVRQIWEESMAKVAKEQEELEVRIGESEQKRKRTKRALRDALEGQVSSSQDLMSSTAGVPSLEDSTRKASEPKALDSNLLPPQRRPASSGLTAPKKKSTIEEMANISDSESDDDEEFFDAIGAGEVQVVEEMPSTVDETKPQAVTDTRSQVRHDGNSMDIWSSCKGYEDPVRVKLKMDADDRPKISLWSILKSMIGKDMTKMTLPVSFNEPTSLLQRVAEDMEYTDLLGIAASRQDSTERLVYVAAFAASEYASTIGRVAKPFNPLLGETYEYVRPDKGYRFFVEQVSHHPPVGAAYAESAHWEYYGESAVRSKFYGKSFDINPLGTWFLRLRPTASTTDRTNTIPKEELYTWKKVTSSVIGIITGSPTVDNYGPMELKNHTTGETCILDFKPRGWKASSAYQVAGKVLDAAGAPRWSIGGRWNDKIYARLTPGYESVVEAPTNGATKAKGDTNQAFLVWEAHARPSGTPFNLTPFGVTLNALPDKLKAVLPPTDTRLRPDQRAMEDGEYYFAAQEKNRVEEKQRAKRREREARGEEFVPMWFEKKVEEVTGEEFWDVRREVGGDAGERGKGGVRYWERRRIGAWQGCEDIF